MAYQVKSKEELQKELETKTNNLAVLKSKVAEQSQQLGIKPNSEVIDGEIKKLEEDLSAVDSQIESIVKELEALDSESETEPSAVEQSQPKDEEFE